MLHWSGSPVLNQFLNMAYHLSETLKMNPALAMKLTCVPGRSFLVMNDSNPDMVSSFLTE